ncbi:ABC transporter substrate-binding protein [Saccharopolyspora sp. NPDC002686]|uniref:ABC transporter substrate-binding protein n=1 Tax=Saccharopolyspora sp. NPDC002686 TaxID=3154541 RepID=UPI00331C1136
MGAWSPNSRHRSTRPVVVLAVLAACAALLSGCLVPRAAGGKDQQGVSVPSGPARLPDEIRQRGVIVVAGQLASPPLGYLDSDGKTVRGLNKDIAEELGRRLGVQVRFEQYPFAGLIPAVQSGKADVAMDLIGDTEERRRLVDFVDYLDQATTMLVPQGNPLGLGDVGDLCGRAVAVVRGGVQLALAEETSGKCAASGKPPLDVQQLNNPADARLQVQSGRVAAFLGNTPVLRYIADTAEGGQLFDTAGSGQHQRQPIGIITAKDKTELRDALIATLGGMFSDGSLARLVDQYGLGDLALQKPVVNGQEVIR